MGVVRSSLVQQFLDGLSDRPGAQQRARVALKAVERWALVRDLLPFPITTGTEIVGGGDGHRPWTDAQVATADILPVQIWLGSSHWRLIQGSVVQTCFVCAGPTSKRLKAGQASCRPAKNRTSDMDTDDTAAHGGNRAVGAPTDAAAADGDRRAVEKPAPTQRGVDAGAGAQPETCPVCGARTPWPESYRRCPVATFWGNYPPNCRYGWPTLPYGREILTLR